MKSQHASPSFSGILKQAILENLQSESLDNTFLARQLYLSEAQFYRKVKKEFGCSPNILIRKIRLLAAFDLLQSGRRSVREVAFTVGFTHVGYFIRRFEEQFGKSPGQLMRDKL